MISKGFNSFQIKMFMAILMVLDHLPHIPNLIDPMFAGVIHVFTRVVGVWFAFVAVEGFIYTKNRAQYLIRLFSWAAVMQLGNLLIDIAFNVKISNNIFLTLGIGVLLLNIISLKMSSILFKSLKWILFVVVLFLGISFSEGGPVILPFILITYSTKSNIKLRNLLYIVMSILLFMISYVAYEDIATTIEMLMFNSDFMFILVLPFIYLYNGLRGPKTIFSKYFFYIFYPIHLWIIGIITYIVS